MKAKDAILYFTDPETGKRCRMKFEKLVLQHTEDDTKEKTWHIHENGRLHFGPVQEELMLRFKNAEFSKIPEVKHVVHSNNVCTVIWDDGVKTQAVCHPEDTYNKDVGLLVAYLKRFMPTEDIINLVEKWSHQQKKQEDVQARKKSEKARKQFHEEMDAFKKEIGKIGLGGGPSIHDIDPVTAVWGMNWIDEVAETVEKELNEIKKKAENAEWEYGTLLGLPIKYKKL